MLFTLASASILILCYNDSGKRLTIKFYLLLKKPRNSQVEVVLGEQGWVETPGPLQACYLSTH
jgi:hypothetical protein